MAGHGSKGAGTGGPASGQPARGYSWEPFGKDNEAAVKHGAYSKRLLSERAAEIEAELVAAAPELGAERYSLAVRDLAYVEAGLERWRAWYDESGFTDDDGKVRPGVADYRSMVGYANRLRDSLMLTTRSAIAGLSQLAGAKVDPGRVIDGDAVSDIGVDILRARRPHLLPDDDGGAA